MHDMISTISDKITTSHFKNSFYLTLSFECNISKHWTIWTYLGGLRERGHRLAEATPRHLEQKCYKRRNALHKSKGDDGAGTAKQRSQRTTTGWSEWSAAALANHVGIYLRSSRRRVLCLCVRERKRWNCVSDPPGIMIRVCDQVDLRRIWEEGAEARQGAASHCRGDCIAGQGRARWGCWRSGAWSSRCGWEESCSTWLSSRWCPWWRCWPCAH